MEEHKLYENFRPALEYAEARGHEGLQVVGRLRLPQGGFTPSQWLEKVISRWSFRRIQITQIPSWAWMVDLCKGIVTCFDSRLATLSC